MATGNERCGRAGITWRWASRIALRDDVAADPDDDLQALLMATGQWQFQHKDGTPY